LLVARYNLTRQRGSYTGPLSGPIALAVGVKLANELSFFDSGQIFFDAAKIDL
jgi:hypothetical protein